MNLQQLIAHYQTFHKNIIKLYSLEKSYYKKNQHNDEFSQLKQNLNSSFGKYETYLEKRRKIYTKNKNILNISDAQKQAAIQDQEFFYSIVDELKKFYDYQDFTSFYINIIRPQTLNTEIIQNLQKLQGFKTQDEYILMKKLSQ